MTVITGYGNGATIQPLDSGKSRGASGSSGVSGSSGSGSASGTYNASSSTFGASGVSGVSGASGASGADDAAKKARMKELKPIYDAYLILLDNYRTKEEAYARILSKIDDLEKEGKEVPASLQEEYEKANEAATQAAVALGTYEDEHSKDIEEYKQLAGVE